MKYPYHIDYTKFGSPIMRLPKEIELVTTFLFSDVQGPLGRSFFLEEIEHVLQREVPYSEIAGNVCGLKIKQEFTQVIDMLADDGIGHTCMIETEELKKLIEVWCVVTNGPVETSNVDLYVPSPPQ